MSDVVVRESDVRGAATERRWRAWTGQVRGLEGHPVLSIILGRVLQMVVVLVALSFLVNLLTSLMPGDPAAAVAGEEASPEKLEQVRRELNLDKPFVVRYWIWLVGAVQGNLGTSVVSGESVTELIGGRIPVTLSLGLVALVISVVVGVLLGAVAAMRPDSLVDRTVTFVASLGLALPSFWVGMMAISLVAVNRGWFPALGYSPISEGVWPWLHHLLLPGFALATSPISIIARQTRGSLRDVMLSDYIRTARAKGVGPVMVAAKHGGKNAAITVVTTIGNVAGVLFGGTIVIESLFVLPGIGTAMIRAALSRDLPVIQGAVLFAAAATLLINLLVDLSYRYFNPRLRGQ